jgi:hypothetical protein
LVCRSDQRARDRNSRDAEQRRAMGAGAMTFNFEGAK